VAGFDWAKVNTVGPIFDLKKLDWLNGEYIRALSPDELADRIIAHLAFTGEWVDPDPAKVELLRRATPLIHERLGVLSEAVGKLEFLFTLDADLVVADDARAQLGDDAAAVLDAAIDALQGVQPFDTPSIEAALRASLIEGLGLKPRFAFGPVRVGITGSRVSPPLFESIELLGRESSLTRLRALRSSLGGLDPLDQQGSL
jgi:glutamyl-tRNA synthetase